MHTFTANDSSQCFLSFSTHSVAAVADVDVDVASISILFPRHLFENRFENLIEIRMQM